MRLLIEKAKPRLGRIDILVHNAGPGAYMPFLELPPERWHYVMNTNVTALYLLARTLAPQMRENGWGRMIAIGAASARIRSDSVYGSPRPPCLHLTESLAVGTGARDHRQHGFTWTGLPTTRTCHPPYAAATASETPMARLVRRAEVAEAVISLCHE